MLLSISHVAAKGIPHDSETPHVCYCLTQCVTFANPDCINPCWQGPGGDISYEFLPGVFGNGILSPMNIDCIVGISRAVQERVQRVYKRDCEVICLCVDLDFYRPLDIIKRDFYLVVSSLAPQIKGRLGVRSPVGQVSSTSAICSNCLGYRDMAQRRPSHPPMQPISTPAPISTAWCNRV